MNGDDWKGLLAPREQVLWKGRPSAGLRFGTETVATGIFAVILMLIAGGLGMMLEPDMPGAFAMLFWPALAVGVLIVLAYPFYESALRRRQSYVLTDKRAFLLGRHPGVQLPGDTEGFPIPPADRIKLIGNNVYFARRPLRSSKAPKRVSRDIGFLRISEAARVHDMMRRHAPTEDRP